jgi:hypothetical protein
VSVNVENMRKWVDRLRDPQAKQAKWKLRGADGAMCAMGHACDVSGLGAWWLDKDDVEEHWVFGESPALGYFATLDGVLDWLGVEDGEVVVSFGGDVGDVVELNDDVQLSLPEIADLIEAEFLS